MSLLGFKRGRRGGGASKETGDRRGSLADALRESTGGGGASARRPDDLRAALRESKDEPARRSRRGDAPPRGRADGLRDAFVQSLRLLRQAAPAGARTVQALREVEAYARTGDGERAAERLRSLSFHPAAPEGAGEIALRLFHLVVQGALPLATSLAVRGARDDLRTLQKDTDALPDVEARPVKKLLSVFERLGVHGAKTREVSDLMRGCVGELIETLGRLEAEEETSAADLRDVRVRLDRARDVQELAVLRDTLLRAADDLVSAAEARRDAVQVAVEEARASQERAAELEAALTDAAEQARTDALTGLGNRRALQETIRRRNEGEVGVLALDLDHFKKVNDVHGHAAGDEVLRYLAELLHGELRGDDRAFRVGGEEFVVLLPDGSWQGARATAERLRARLERRPVRVSAEAEVAVTCSVGVGLWAPGQRADEALAAADAALYRAKASGRNRVVG